MFSCNRRTVACLCVMEKSISLVEDGRTVKPQTLFFVMTLQRALSREWQPCPGQYRIMAVWPFIDIMKKALNSNLFFSWKKKNESSGLLQDRLFKDSWSGNSLPKCHMKIISCAFRKRVNLTYQTSLQSCPVTRVQLYLLWALIWEQDVAQSSESLPYVWLVIKILKAFWGKCLQHLCLCL